MRRLLTIGLAFLSTIGWAGTCGNGYTYSKKITIDHLLVPSTQTNFPFLLCFNGACTESTNLTDLKTVANGGKIQNTANNAISVSGPADLVFCDAASAGTAIKYETALYTATTGAMEAYVQIASLSSSSDTILYMFYGNSGVSTTQQDLSLWTDVSYAAVYHFPDGSTLGLKDSTSNANNGTNHSATATTGKIDGGINISSQYATAASSATFKPTAAITIDAWTLTNSCPTVAVIAGVGYRNTGVWSEPFWAWGFRNFQCRPVITIAVGGTRKDSGFTGTQTVTGAWYYQAGVYDGSNLKTYLNGDIQNNPAQSGSIDYNSGGSDALAIGTDSAASQGEYWDGKLDEVRISTIARSTDWLKLSYNNGIAPSSMYSVATPTGACSGYSFRRTIVQDHTKIPNTDQTNFPMLVAGTYSWLATVANGGNLQNASGFDVCFASDSAGTTALPYDTDYWTAATGASAYWFPISLSHTVDTSLYIFYGNSSITTAQTNPAAVWGPNYKAVYHLGNGSSLSLSDSGLAANTLTQTGTVTAASGIIGGSALFTSGNYLATSGFGMPSGTTTRVESMWMKFTSSSSPVRIGGYGSAGTQGQDFRFEWVSPNFALSIGNGSRFGTWTLDTSWHYIVAVFSGTTNNDITIYMDGVLFGSTGSVNVWTLATPGCCIDLSGSAGSFQFPGNIDEFRVRTGSETVDWVASEYANQNSPSTFYSISGATSIASKKRQAQVY
jgi:hypothetical protein